MWMEGVAIPQIAGQSICIVSAAVNSRAANRLTHPTAAAIEPSLSHNEGFLIKVGPSSPCAIGSLEAQQGHGDTSGHGQSKRTVVNGCNLFYADRADPFMYTLLPVIFQQ